MFNKDYFIGLTSQQLFDLLKENRDDIAMVEAFMANGVIRATHQISLIDVYISNGFGVEPDVEFRILDTGIDGEEEMYDVDEWLRDMYPDATWWISEMQATDVAEYEDIKALVVNNENYKRHYPKENV